MLDLPCYAQLLQASTRHLHRSRHNTSDPPTHLPPRLLLVLLLVLFLPPRDARPFCVAAGALLLPPRVPRLRHVSEFTSGMSSSSHKRDSSEKACTHPRPFAILEEEGGGGGGGRRTRRRRASFADLNYPFYLRMFSLDFGLLEPFSGSSTIKTELG